MNRIFVPARRVGAVSMALVALTLLAGCSGSGSDSDAANGVKTINIAYSVDTIDTNQNKASEGMKEAVAKFNESSETTKVVLTQYDAQGSLNKQLSDIQTALVKKPDVLIISAVDPQGVLPAVRQAKAAGVKVIDRRPSNPPAPEYDVAFQMSDSTSLSAATKAWLIDYLETNPSVNLKAGIIYGAPAQTAELQRVDVIKEVAEEMPDRIEIVASGYGNWLTATAQNLTTDFLQAHPDLNYIASANDDMALGAANAIKTAGKTDSIMLSGYDLQPDAIERVKNGEQTFDTGVPIRGGGAQLIDIAIGVAQGTFTEKTGSVEPVYAITVDNVDTVADLE